MNSILGTLLKDNPIAVTGMGSFSSAGSSVDALWKAASAGRSLAVWNDFSDEEDPVRFAVCPAPPLDLSRPELHVVRKLDRSVQVAAFAAHQAWTQASLTDAYPSERIGIIVGSSRGPLGKQLLSARRQVAPSLAANSTFASLSGALAQSFQIKGPGATVTATCASSAYAIGFAAEQILLGQADAVLVGGAEAPLKAVLLAQLHASGVVGSHEEAEKTCRPFDATRNGLVLGEGSGFLVLESARMASARGANILAYLSGWSARLDNTGRTGVSENGEALQVVMQNALQLANLRPDQIDYINAHGTGTKLNDLAEAQSVNTLFGRSVPCSSTKPITGHCLGATSAMEAIICIEAMRHQVVPPTANCVEPDPLCAINAQPLVAKSAKISHVMTNSLGFWGYHASLVFSKS